MRKQQRKTAMNFFNNEKGSFSVEASLVFPLIMIATIALIYFSIGQWEKALLYKQATVLSEQLATNWDVRGKDLFTGEFEFSKKVDDGLYWRIFNDGSTSSDSSESGFPDQKIEKAIQHLRAKGISGTITYDRFPGRTITVTLNRNLGFPLLSIIEIFPAVKNEITVTAKAHVAEPVEFIRNIDLAIKYGSEIEQRFGIIDRFRKNK